MIGNKYESYSAVKEIDEIFTSEKKPKMQNFTENLNNQAIFSYLQNSNLLKNPIKILETALAQIQKSCAQTHKNEFTIKNNLAVFYFLNKNFKKANDTIVEMYSKIKENRQKKPIHLVNLALMVSKSGEILKAKKIIDKILTRIESPKNYKEDSPTNLFDVEFTKKLYLISSMNNVKIGDFERALEDLEKYGKFLPKGEDDPVAKLNFLRLKAMVFVKMGELGKAKEMLEIEVS